MSTPVHLRSTHFTAFLRHRCVASGSLAEVAVAVARAAQSKPIEPLYVYGDLTGRVVDVDTRGTEAEIAARYAPTDEDASAGEPRGRGRPKLGVIAREVTLLPRHWDWLGAQPGGASVALRKLVDEARRANTDKDRKRIAHEAAYRFMSGMAGDFANFEEAIRSLFADDRDRFTTLIDAWPPDIRDYAMKLAFGDGAREGFV